MVAGAAVGALGLNALAVAPAAALAPPDATYGGGFLTAAAPLVGVRVSPGGDRIALEGEAIAHCAGTGPIDERLTLRTTLATDGSFRGRVRRVHRVSAIESRTVWLSASGTVVDASRAIGLLRLVAFVQRRHRATVRCDSRIQHWEARSVSSLPAGPPVPLAGVSYYGATRQAGRYVPFPLALHVSRDRARVDAAVFRVYRRCRGVASGDVSNDTLPATIRADGSFSVVQRYSQRFTDSIESFTFRFAGRFATLGATGTLRTTSILRDPRTHRVIGRCDSGTVAWAAVP